MALIASRYCRATKRATSISGLVGHEEIGGASGRGETRPQVGQTRGGKHDEWKKPGEVCLREINWNHSSSLRGPSRAPSSMPG